MNIDKIATNDATVTITSLYAHLLDQLMWGLISPNEGKFAGNILIENMMNLNFLDTNIKNIKNKQNINNANNIKIATNTKTIENKKIMQSVEETIENMIGAYKICIFEMLEILLKGEEIC